MVISKMKFISKFKRYRRILTFILLPFVVIGLIYIFSLKKASEVTAIDLIKVTYNGHGTDDPIFTLDDFKPGDVEQKCFTVKNVNTTESFDVLMRGNMTLEEKQFADILEIIINKTGGSDIYGGTQGFKTLQNFLDDPNSLNLGNYSPGAENTYCITVKFPPESGNEYQQAKVVFDIIWSTEISESRIPPECRHLTIERIVEGTEGKDNIHGSAKSELILGKGGNDKINGSSGDDCIVGGDGDDKIDGGSGNDVILGGNGNDQIDASAGNDTIYGGDGNDKIDASSGDDLIYGGAGNDKIDAGAGNDIVYGGDGEDIIDGETGNDKLYGENGNDSINGGAGNDELYGGEGNDNLHGGVGNDFLDGGGGTDTLYGDNGNNTCINGEYVYSCKH